MNEPLDEAECSDQVYGAMVEAMEDGVQDFSAPPKGTTVYFSERAVLPFAAQRAEDAERRDSVSTLVDGSGRDFPALGRSTGELQARRLRRLLWRDDVRRWHRLDVGRRYVDRIWRTWKGRWPARRVRLWRLFDHAVRRATTRPAHRPAGAPMPRPEVQRSMMNYIGRSGTCC